MRLTFLLQSTRRRLSVCDGCVWVGAPLSVGVGPLAPVNSIIELHDSTVAEFATLDGAVIVHFLPAYLHKSEGRPGVDSGTGWVQEARLIFADASASGISPELPCDAIDGELVVGEERHDNEIPVPLEVTAPAQLRLIFDSIHTVTVKGRGVRLELLGEPRYVEDFVSSGVIVGRD